MSTGSGSVGYESTRVDLNRDLKLAIAEYAPGEKTVANKRIWESIGLRVMKNKNLLEFEQWECKECKEPGVRKYIKAQEEIAPCQNCGSAEKPEKKVNFIVPSFGFVGRMSQESPGESRPPRSTYTESYYSEYQEITNEEFKKLSFGKIDLEYRYSRQGQITVVTQGAPFKFCSSCGYTAKISTEKKSEEQGNEHPMPGGAWDNMTCKKMLSYKHLGHQYLTDVAEIRIPTIKERGQALSVMYAMLASTTSVGIDPSDLGGTLRAKNALVIFDTVPGGAGHVKRFIDKFGELSREALQLVRNCECGEDTSCYGCLRNFGNQAMHNELNRGSAKEILSSIVGS